MKRGLLLNLKPVLEKLLDQEMSLANALILVDFAGKFSSELAAIEEDRVALVKKFGDKREDGGTEVIDEEKKEKFKKAFDKSLNKEIEFELLDGSVFDSIKVKPVDATGFKPLFK
jgi:hypothetical protein